MTAPKELRSSHPTPEALLGENIQTEGIVYLGRRLVPQLPVLRLVRQPALVPDWVVIQLQNPRRPQGVTSRN